MKRLIITILVVIALISIGIIGTVPGTLAGSPEGKGPSHGKGPPSAIESIKFLDDVEMAPEELILGEWWDVSSYSKFKIYAKVTPGPSSFPITEDPPTVEFSLFESPESGELGLSWVSNPVVAWKGWYMPDPPISFWGLVWEFEGIYSHIVINAWNLPEFLGGDGDTHTVSAWIIMGN